MDKQTALSTLGLNGQESAEQIKHAFEEKKSDLTNKIETSATDALKPKFESMLQKVEQAYAEWRQLELASFQLEVGSPWREFRIVWQ